MIASTAAQQAFLTELNLAPNAASRAQILYDIIRVAYDRTKFVEAEDEGLDGRDGPERQALGEVVDAALAAIDDLTV